MIFEVIATDPFERKLKRLAKNYKSLKADIAPLFESLATNPKSGTPIGNDCYKIRLAITSKGKGKSGGARIITFIRITKNTVYLMDIYDKSEQADMSEKDIKGLLDILTKD